MSELTFREAETAAQFDEARTLFNLYGASLSIDLSFQDFDTELRNIAVQYSRPKGSLLIGYVDNLPGGCVACRHFTDEIAELKRMYVMPEYRSMKMGVRLLSTILDIAKELGYKYIRLDTLPDMLRAQNLYVSFGFYQIPSYRFNPVEGTVYMEKIL